MLDGIRKFLGLDDSTGLNEMQRAWGRMTAADRKRIRSEASRANWHSGDSQIKLFFDWIRNH